MPPQEKEAKSSNPKRGKKKMSAPARNKLRKIREAAASDEEGRKLSSPTPARNKMRKIKEEAEGKEGAKKLPSQSSKHRSSWSGRDISKHKVQMQNARSCRNYELEQDSEEGPRMVRLEDLSYKKKVKPKKGKNKKRRRSDMLKVVRAQAREYGVKHLRHYFIGAFYQPRLAAEN
jgi:hypothetical protein